MNISDFDFILLLIIGYGIGVASGLCYCVKYRNVFLTKSKSIDSLKQHNHQNILYPPTAQVSPVIKATAPPPTPLKLTIE